MPEPLIERLNEALPQTQCTRCGYPSCRDYARAMSEDGIAPNRCPPGGTQGIAQLAQLLNQPAMDLADDVGPFGARLLATIEAAHCIGCTKCIIACPVDAIIGGPKRMHTVLPSLCSGCELCLAPCPVDCIRMTPLDDADAWTEQDALAARERFEHRQARRARNDEQDTMRHISEAQETLATMALAGGSSEDPDQLSEKQRKKAIIEAAIARARERQSSRNGNTNE